ncbi:phosphopantetheine-binding protein [Gallaecimonas kandeliae]|uniref:phosphopantetheine-binding protein n=1 Tax=Gallaecimonas kandeliae TaxID=3029055 RepID=UPI0026498E77|nr:phosphopantetheine-binding protein [Gallaecimonas kandeliae]WKE64001.1 phosphopantetheine-binding protein [Gallaecimonas kandeliae]
MTNLENELKALIINALELEDVTADDIDTTAPLFGDGLGLDSIDALELGLAIQKRFQVKIDANAADTKSHFASVRALADFIRSQEAVA